ncbi:MAG TPA: UDP-N-acetylmuramoyl-L-alanine--D-glutamate ligase [Acidimicrobiales bacterium]|nr:UDP-N-acetylmuramoyl-L-alanine--D-glutamate ligase [Acidimicrobiales bacterium]
MSDSYLVVGFGVTGAAVARALVQRGEHVVAVDDRPGDAAVEAARELGLELVAGPDVTRLGELVRDASALLPAPGLPATHPAFDLARELGTPVLSEFDLAARWDDRPLLAITGTDGKTTVTTLTCEMLEASGLAAQAVGNTPVPLVAAVDDPTVDVFVVEASSFRLDHSRRFAPAVGTWLNFAPDHLDNHRSLAEYEAAKARIWRDQSADQVAIGNVDDPVVARHLAAAPARRIGFGRDAGEGAYRVADGVLVTPGGAELARVDELPRSFPHDLLNGLAAAATALAGGGSLDGVRAALRGFDGLPHRVTLVGEAGGVRFFDDSKATTPHAVLAAVEGFPSLVLICGGRNKGLDLSSLAAAAPRTRAVVAIGDATSEVTAAFLPTGVPVRPAASMDEAVALAAAAAEPGDAVLLSPGCASFDWYRSYGERGDDFARAVQAHLAANGAGERAT